MAVMPNRRSAVVVYSHYLVSRNDTRYVARLEAAGVGTACHWLALQSTHDLWQAQHREQPPVEQLISA